MKNISTEVDYIGKSDVCLDGNSLLTLVTGVGEENNRVKPVSLSLMATSEPSSDHLNEKDALSLLKGSAVASNGYTQFYPNGVMLPQQQQLQPNHHYQHLTNTWPCRIVNSAGISRNINNNNNLSLESGETQYNGHHVSNNEANGTGPCELIKPRKMVRSASMDGLDISDVYKQKLFNGSSELTEVLSVTESLENKLKDSLNVGYRRASDPLNTNHPRPLNAVLESIPLAYNPQTKQLHLIKPKRSPPLTLKSANCDDDFDNCCPASGSTKYNYCQIPSGKCNGTNNKTNDLTFSTENAHHALLQRVSTCGSLQSKADCSSFSSISSLCTDLSTASALEDNYSDLLTGRHCSLSLDDDESNFIEINLNSHHRNRSVAEGSHVEDTVSLDDQCHGQGVKSKRRGISGFLTRNLLAWRTSRESNVGADDSPGWKLFGKNPVRAATSENPHKIIEEYHERQCEQNGIGSPSSTPRNRRCDELVASSTTALILENRPSNLPSKAPEEEERHRLEYQLMKKLDQQQLRHEEQLSQAAKWWNTEVLPSWETAKNCRKAKKMWWQGIPPSVRGKVWQLAIGNDLHITHELYEICVCRAKDRIRMAAELISVSEDDFEENLQDKEGSVELIKLDVSRTFPQLCIFQKRGPCYDMLHSLLGAYVCYRPDVGYVQGMSFLAAVLILNLEVADAFICFSNLMNKPCQLAFFRLDEQKMKSYFLTYEEYFSENLPKLFNHFRKQNLSPDLYLIDWIYTLYSRSLPFDVACRVWDVYFRDGDEFLFRTALGILRLYDDILLNMEFIHLAQFLTKLPEDIGSDELFKSIESIRMVIDKRSFAQVLQSYSEPKQT
ncbi:hypothetical protein CHUAL_008095 [Chamberlinius hualienensis]